MLTIENIRNLKFRLSKNDIYIGGKWQNFPESELVRPDIWSFDHFKQHILDNANPNSYYWDYIQRLIGLHNEDEVYRLVCWDIRDGKMIIEAIEEIIGLEHWTEYDSHKEQVLLFCNENGIYNLTDCQFSSLVKFREFLESKDKDKFLLTGGAGVGKSYLMDAMIKMIGGERCIILSPKHKIKKLHTDKNVLDNLTYQSFFGIRPNYKKVDKRTGIIPYDIISPHKTKEKIAELLPNYDAVIFFEETSMIESQVYDYICDYLGGCKKVFVGDTAQISPIGEEVSPTISEADITAELKTVVRYSGKLLEYCTQIRNEILNNCKVFSFHQRRNDNEMIETLTSEMSAVFKFIELFHSGINVRMLAFTNNKVEYYNDKLNQVLYPEEYAQGFKYFSTQVLQSNGNSDVYKPCIRLSVAEYRNGLFVKQHILLNKFDEITVNEVEVYNDSLISHNSILEQLDNECVYLELLRSFGLEQDVRAYGKEYFIKLINVRLEWYFLTCVTEKGNEITIRTLSEKSEKFFFGLSDLFKKQKLWLLNNFLLSMNDWIQPALAMTIDQSQGSTYDQIILNTAGIENEKNIRRYYVGITRAKHKLYLLKE